MNTELPPAFEPTSFDDLDEDELDSHMKIYSYAGFQLTDAIRPSWDLKVKPAQGYRHDRYEREEGDLPALMISASAEILFELFWELLQPLHTIVHVFCMSSHKVPRGIGPGRMRDDGKYTEEPYREDIELAILRSRFVEFQDLLMNDGCTGVAVVDQSRSIEVQLDEHKLIIIYGNDFSEFEAILQRFGVECREDIQFITEAEHIHASSDEYQDRFYELVRVLGAQ